MGHVLLAGLGGFLGSSLRYLVNIGVLRVSILLGFPIGTLIVNVSGCLCIGLLAGLVENRQMFSPELRTFVFVGILGGFTTFSSFGLDTYGLWQENHLLAGLNILLHMVLGLGSVVLGFQLARYF